MKSIVLDTNCYAAYLAGDGDVLEALAAAQIVVLPVFVLGELFAGFKGGVREKENRRLLDRFLNKPTVHAPDATDETAEIFGMIKSGLRKAGTPVPVNDIWIAAQAMETGSILVTYDRHFTKIAGLRIWQGLTIP